jgi:hypothetical protein
VDVNSVDAAVGKSFNRSISSTEKLYLKIAAVKDKSK